MGEEPLSSVNEVNEELAAPLVSAEETVEPSLPPFDLVGGSPWSPVLRRRKALIVVLGGLTAFGPLSIDMYLPSLPHIAQDLQCSASAVQLSLTACLAGLAVGQLIAGPLSDSRGRRHPLMAGVLVYIAASLLCAFSPSIAVLIGLRFLQGLGGSAGIVIARAVVRDLYDGVAAARFFSRLMLVSGLAPILAPIVGGQLLRVTNWRGVFVVLALIGGVLLLGVVVGVPETWPPARRHGGGLADRLRGMGILVADRQLLGYALACGLAFAAMFAYISGSPFVVENIYGASPQLFSLAFAANAFGLAAAGQVNGRLVGSIAPRRLLTFGLGLTSGAGLTLLAVVLSGAPGLPTLLVPLFVLVASLGFVMPNATALALSGHPEAAGSASALVGSIQYVVGALVAPLVGIAGSYTAVPMAIVISALGVGAMTALLTMTGGRPSSG